MLSNSKNIVMGWLSSHPPNYCQQHYIFTSWKIKVPWRSKKDSTRASTTHNWVRLYYTTSTLGHVQIKSKLCYNNQTKCRLIVNSWIYWIYRKSYMVVTHNINTQEKGQVENLYKFQKIKCNHKERSIPITFRRWNVEHNSRVWGIFFLKWIFKISSNIYNSKGQIQDCICYKLRGFYMEGDAIWNWKWTSNISENCEQSIQRIFRQFYEDISGWLYNV